MQRFRCAGSVLNVSVVAEACKGDVLNVKRILTSVLSCATTIRSSKLLGELAGNNCISAKTHHMCSAPPRQAHVLSVAMSSAPTATNSTSLFRQQLADYWRWSEAAVVGVGKCGMRGWWSFGRIISGCGYRSLRTENGMIKKSGIVEDMYENKKNRLL